MNFSIFKMDEIDYNIKIQNFLAMTETGDPETASKYLEATNWDETKAVNKFFNTPEITPNLIKSNLINDINLSDNSESNMITSDNKRLDTNLIINKKNINNNKIKINNNKKQNFFKKYILNPINFFFDCCSERREVTKDEEKKIFNYLPNTKDDFIEFCEIIKRRIGIIIFYTSNNVPFLNDLISQICRSSISFNLLKQNFVIYPLLANTNEGYRTQNIISDNQLIFPSFVFCYNPSKYPNVIFNKNHVISMIEGESITLTIFHQKLLETSKKLNFNKNNNLINEIDKSFGPLTDAEILSQQNFDMTKLENEAIKKEEELKMEKIKEDNRQEEEKIKLKQIEDKANEAKKKIVEEPSSNEKDSTEICFRYPDGEKTKNRRFLKSHTIQNLYDYITSLGKEIYSENENSNFSLCQVFPPKKYNIMENTLEQEGLFPNAVVQIKEE